MRRIAIVVIAAIVIAAIGAFAWRIFSPGPLAFAGGSTVALTDYREANPTGVPAGLAKADLVERGEYLAKAADCMVCHTAPGGADYAGGLAFPLPFGTLYSTNITADKDTGIGNYSDQDFLDAVQRGVPQGRCTAVPGHALHVIHLHDRRRRAGDQGLPVEPARRAEAEPTRYVTIPV